MLHFSFYEDLCFITEKALFKARGAISTTSKIIYLVVDESSKELLGSEPIPISFYTKTIQGLLDYSSPKAIGIDKYFGSQYRSKLIDDTKVAYELEEFCSLLHRNSKIVLGIEEEVLKEISNPTLAPLGLDLKKNQMSLGILDTPTHAVLNRIPLFERTQEAIYFSMAVELFCLVHQVPKNFLRIDHQNLDFINKNGKILLSVPLSDEKFCEINWLSSWDSSLNKKISFIHLLEMINAMKQESEMTKKLLSQNFFSQFSNAIILITHPQKTASQSILNPFENTSSPLAFVQGNLVQNFLTQSFLIRCSGWAYWLILISFYSLLFALLFFDNEKRRYDWFCLILVCTLGLALYSFCAWNIVLPLADIFLLSILLFVSHFFSLYQVEKNEHKRITQLFGSYLSPEVIKSIVDNKENPEIGGEVKEITAFFSDIQNFSMMAEVLPAMQLVELMNEYLSALTQILQEEQGTLDKYIGDAIIAMFGAPLPVRDHAIRACISALRMQARQNQIWSEWVRKEKFPERIHPLRTRIGLNSGTVVVGNMGSNIRFNYTMMGDNVNLTARCETVGKTYGTYILVSDQTHRLAMKDTSLVFRFLDTLVLKGKTKAIGLYELVGEKNKLPTFAFDCIECYERAFRLYLQRRWNEAISLFEKSANLEIFKPNPAEGIYTNPSLVFIERCAWYEKNPPPEDWNKSFVMETK